MIWYINVLLYSTSLSIKVRLVPTDSFDQISPWSPTWYCCRWSFTVILNCRTVCCVCGEIIVVMVMSIIKSSSLIYALMGYTLVNQIIVKLNSLILLGGNPQGPSSLLDSLFSKYFTLILSMLQPPIKPLFKSTRHGRPVKLWIPLHVEAMHM